MLLSVQVSSSHPRGNFLLPRQRDDAAKRGRQRWVCVVAVVFRHKFLAAAVRVIAAVLILFAGLLAAAAAGGRAIHFCCVGAAGTFAAAAAAAAAKSTDAGNRLRLLRLAGERGEC